MSIQSKIHASARLAQAAVRKAHLPKACFLGVTVVGLSLFAVLVRLSH